MAGLLVMGEVTADGLPQHSAEVATLAGRSSGKRARRRSRRRRGRRPAAAAAELAGYVPRVVAHRLRRASARSMVAAGIGGLSTPLGQFIFVVPAGPDGRDLAGMLSALTGWGVLANAAASWDDGPTVEMSVFGGKLTTTSAFTGRRRGSSRSGRTP